MEKFIEFIIRNRRAVIAFTLILTLLLGYEMLRVALNADFSTYLRQDDPVVRQFNMIGEEYAGKSIALVLVESDDVFQPQTLKLIQDLTSAYEGIEEIAGTVALRGEKISFGGMPFLMYHMTLNIVDAVTWLVPFMLLLMLLILFWGFRKAGGVFHCWWSPSAYCGPWVS